MREPVCRLSSLAIVLIVAFLIAACAGPTVTAERLAVDTVAPPRAGQPVLLGEIHDHMLGHERRLQLLKAWLDNGLRPVIVMEQFDRDRQSQLDNAMTGCGNAQCVIDRAGAGQWQWMFYRPLIELALGYRLRIIAGNIPRAQAGRVVREGFAAVFDAATMARFELTLPLPGELAMQQSREIIDGHCGMLAARVVPGMVNAQVARDIWMALLILEQASDPVILIAGNGHIRRDIGVPFWLRQQDVDRATAVGFVEPRTYQGARAFDQTIELPAQARPDPCASFRQPLQPAGRDGRATAAPAK